MRRIVALSVTLVCIWGVGAAAQAEGTPPSDAPTEASAAAAPPGESIDAGTYAVRLRDLEQRINELKEQIFRSKARLSLLAETVLEGVVGGGQAVILMTYRGDW